MQIALCTLYFAVLLLLASYGLHRSHLVFTCLRLRKRLAEIRSTASAEPASASDLCIIRG